MEIRSALLEIDDDGRESFETRMLVAEFARREVPTSLVRLDEIADHAKSHGPSALVAGSVPFVRSGLGALGMKIPKPNDYPRSIRPLLARRVWKTGLSRVRWLIRRGESRGLFVKPCGSAKLFTGRVVRSNEGLSWLRDYPASTPVWCSSLVRWTSEWRAFIVNDQITAIENYDGDPKIKCHPLVIEESLRLRRRDAFRPAGYAIDFGVLANGQTAIVEVNDGLGLGANGAEGNVLADVLVARWCQLFS